MTDSEFSEYMKKDGKDLIWNNYNTKIDDDREYRGQWTQDRAMWKGIGQIKHKNGSVYSGMTQNNVPNGKGRWVLSDGDIYQGELVNGIY